MSHGLPPARSRSTVLQDSCVIYGGAVVAILSSMGTAYHSWRGPRTRGRQLSTAPHSRPRRCLSAWRRLRETHSRMPYPSANPMIRVITISILVGSHIGHRDQARDSAVIPRARAAGSLPASPADFHSDVSPLRSGQFTRGAPSKFDEPRV